MLPHLLVLDDDAFVLKEVAHRLSGAFTVECARSLDQAFDALVRYPDIEVVVTDMRLEGDRRGGLRLAQELAEHPSRRGQRRPEVVVLTAWPVIEDASACMETGAFGYVEKGKEDTYDRLESLCLKAARRRIDGAAPGHVPRLLVAKSKVLILVSNPDGTDVLWRDEEVREIREAVRVSRHRDRLDVLAELAVRAEDFRRAMNEVNPAGLHFIGHGNQMSDLLLHGSDERLRAFNKQALTLLLSTFSSTLRLVVFNACFTRELAEAITKHIDCAIAMRGLVNDRAAVTFARAFYDALAAGRSVRDAFFQGKAALLAAGVPDNDAPELVVRAGVDAGKQFLVAGC